ncbi:uncharacterized protein LOC128339697 [Hemicordylus capensis]|uniref:uncharacterized protein LOC128339697 n=1 Tax=Hemicordylus capensis TaxID=884348 RepID=UPI002303FABA|nr:uncharacterized protein LOC128339697 [Hemicordylus capensis]XP_053139998.1 uncharacterized protein LOC128339697 [Hemicordylus capensis]XP_053139999.1 uncharacterized protein LOC128339697 [Hemicordylus capensis]XP_053140000.1 uncharacterized protein LOC128339697 [Hemicordylus capensis]
MDFAKCPDSVEGLRHKFMSVLYMPTDRLLEKTGHMAHQIGERRGRRNCTRGAFSVISTTGSMKLRKRSTSLQHKLPDCLVRQWEDLSTPPDCNLDTPNDWKHQRMNSPVAHMTVLEDPKSFQMAAAWVPPSTGRHNDIDMEPTSDFQRDSESLQTGILPNLPQRAARTSELPKGLGPFADGLGRMPDHFLLMEIEQSESTERLPDPVVAPSPKSLLAEPGGDIIMHDESRIRKSKEISILERVGETLRQKKLRATQL